MALDPQYHHQVIRKECSDEQSLISHRMTWTLMIQAFLFTTFAITLSNQAIHSYWWFTFLVVPLAGIFVAFLTMRPIEAAIHTLEHWHKKEQDFFKSNPDFSPLDRSERGEHHHWLSMRFPKLVPIVFIIIWGFLAIFGTLQVWMKFIPSSP